MGESVGWSKWMGDVRKNPLWRVGVSLVGLVMFIGSVLGLASLPAELDLWSQSALVNWLHQSDGRIILVILLLCGLVLISVSEGSNIRHHFNRSQSTQHFSDVDSAASVSITRRMRLRAWLKELIYRGSDPFAGRQPVRGQEELGRAIVDAHGAPSGSPANYEATRGSASSTLVNSGPIVLDPKPAVVTVTGSPVSVETAKPLGEVTVAAVDWRGSRLAYPKDWVEVTGPFCPADDTALSVVDKAKVTRSADEMDVIGGDDRLVCPRCSRQFTLGATPFRKMQIGVAREKARKKFIAQDTPGDGSGDLAP